MVTIELFGQLRNKNKKIENLDLTEPLAVRMLAEMIDLSMEQIGMVTINGKQSVESDLVPTECRVCFFPHMSGG